MKQLITPNYKIPYVGGLCEGYIEGTVGQATLPTPTKLVTNGVYPSAIAGWKANNGNHPGELPPSGVIVPVFFTLGNVPEGHVALSLADGRVATSALLGYNKTAFIYPSLQAMIDDYAKFNGGCTYLGWSEYIGKVKVVEGDNMATISDAEYEDLKKWKAIGVDAQAWKAALEGSAIWPMLGGDWHNIGAVTQDLVTWKENNVKQQASTAKAELSKAVIMKYLQENLK